MQKEDTYHAKVILPNLLRMAGIKKGERVLDLGCGEGFFAREMAKAGAQVAGTDIAKELILRAREKGGAEYFVAPCLPKTASLMRRCAYWLCKTLRTCRVRLKRCAAF